MSARKGLNTPNRTRLKTRLKKILKKLGNPKGEISVLFTDDKEMKKLNSRYRGKKSSTDVLSFPSGEGPGPESLGDIVISIPFAQKQAKKIGNSLERETLFLLIHGILHLLGYDHEQSEKKAKLMEEKQRELMAEAYS